MKRVLAFICLICVMFCSSVFRVNATVSNVKSYPLPEERKTKLVNFADLEVVLNDEYKYLLTRFDVDEEGNYALGFESSGERGFVYVYNQNNDFLYGLSFNTNGAYGIELCEEGLNIFFNREAVILTYDRNGVCIDAQKLLTKTSDYYTLIDNYLRKTSETVDGRQYSMQRDVNIGSSYSRFVVTDANGVETILYQDSSGPISEIAIFAFGVLFLIGVAILCFKKYEYEDNDTAQ